MENFKAFYKPKFAKQNSNLTKELIQHHIVGILRNIFKVVIKDREPPYFEQL